MRVWFFGRLSDQLGEYIECDVAKSLSIAELRSELAGRFPDAADRLQSRTVRACVGEEIVSEDFAGLTLFDMLKAIDRTMRLTEARVISKSGGSSGDWSVESAGA